MKREFNFNFINELAKKALRTVRGPLKVRNDTPSFLQYDDIGMVAVWAIEDKQIMREKYFGKIAEYNRLIADNIEVNHSIRRKGHYKQNPWYYETKNIIQELRIKRNDVIDSFEERLKKAFDDRTIQDGIEPADVNVEVNSTEVNPITGNDSRDMAVNSGMERFAELICHESNDYFTHYAAGASNIPAGIGQIELFDERVRSPIDVFGWFSAIGTLIRGGAEFSEIIDDFDILESAAFDDDTAGVMAWRTAYTSSVHHTKNSTFPTASHVLYQIPVTASGLIA